MGVSIDNVTEKQLRRLREEASREGDYNLAARCDTAMGNGYGSTSATFGCVRQIHWRQKRWDEEDVRVVLES